jgi:peptidoglycan/LPS O-acetylase OafA/YrhL
MTSAVLIPISWFQWRLMTAVDSIWAIQCASFLVLVITAAPSSGLARAGRSRVLHWFGKYSYGIYVFANLLIPLVSGAITAQGLAAFTGNPILGQVSYFIVMTAATCGAAFLSWHLFECHFVGLKTLFERVPRHRQALA